ncbi:MAG: hypothetical protein ACMG6S_27220 [Byssovorax sp.]
MSPPTTEPTPDAPTRERARVPWLSRWKLGERTAVTLLATLFGVEAWARWCTDPDFYLPDPFRVVVLGLIAIVALSGWIAWRGLRRGIRVLAFVTVAAMLVSEARVRFREAGSGADRIEITDDVLLRYRYRPGATVRVGPKRDVLMRVNDLGLLDQEHVIPKPRDVFRIVVLTGSIANDGAIPFEDRFFRRLEEQLAGAVPDGRKVETINVSCEGYNTAQEVRLLEKVGLRYEPDLVIVAYMLTSAAIQNGAYRRIGNSFFLFRFLPMIAVARTGSICSMFAPFHDSYTFDLIVRSSLERLDLLRRLHGFRVLVAVLPVVEEYGDPVCSRLYDKVVGVAHDVGFETVRVAEAFKGEPASNFAKPGERGDVCHPNSEGHRRIGDSIAQAVRKMLAAPPAASP